MGLRHRLTHRLHEVGTSSVAREQRVDEAREEYAAGSRDRSLPCEGHPTRHSDWSQIQNQKKRGKPGFNWLRPDTLFNY
jgi:hypothetical protein